MREYRLGPEKQRVGNYVGLAMKAGKLAAGDAAASAATKAGQTHLLLLALDTAPSVSAPLIELAAAKDLPILWWPDKVSLGHLAGKSRRGALAVLDKGFSDAILKLCEL